MRLQSSTFVVAAATIALLAPPSLANLVACTSNDVCTQGNAFSAPNAAYRSCLNGYCYWACNAKVNPFGYTASLCDGGTCGSSQCGPPKYNSSIGCRYDTATKVLRCGQTCDDGVTWTDSLNGCGGSPPAAGGLSLGAIVGIAVGGVVVLVLIGLGIYCVRKGKRSTKETPGLVDDGSQGLKRPLLGENPTYPSDNLTQRFDPPPSHYSSSTQSTLQGQSFVLPTMGPGGTGGRPVNAVFTAIFDYPAQNADELSLKLGDQILVLEAYNDGWAYASTTSPTSAPNVQGFVPMSALAGNTPSHVTSLGSNPASYYFPSGGINLAEFSNQSMAIQSHAVPARSVSVTVNTKRLWVADGIQDVKGPAPSGFVSGESDTSSFAPGNITYGPGSSASFGQPAPGGFGQQYAPGYHGQQS
ncbi:hypothetical protein M427DRAFT_139557 [Gonapodya prolifera JEL478]|uniref:SH3 domain-containing protein n=1 Tax=Gonapodya prolifera (strain JEL478) TaxID=1344416 RepID=A0A139A1J8_GONPJ|nr:hypothetical protein M427DRAFT_139557 [Gonapodya prolifera JEL478]|eukprot:KXS10415.1 hypothetical protein M427DRAFT_139557 [Gonapodya prolifera JEL478]